ncbi:MAG: phosphoribosylaminoimidazolesuccinocarboxamide synthase [Nanoarchaeota archaeon]|nr:phosphoribosylaminoimidazolesuccinocarboxamide synthase [Nanoarchaeota archaeon]
MRNDALAAFYVVRKFMKDRGLILVDTKTEHGVNLAGMLVAQDELYTLDSTRYWLADDYQVQMAKLLAGEIKELNPKSYSKEFARGFSEGEKGYTDEQRLAIAVRYILGIQYVLDQPFVPDMRSREERVVVGLQTVVDQVVV